MNLVRIQGSDSRAIIKRSWGKGREAQGLERFRAGVEGRSAESSQDSARETCNGEKDWPPESHLTCR